MSSVEETGPDPTGRRGTWWSATVQWRNWPLLVKLGVVLVVPVVSALVLGVLRVQADVALADSYAATERVAALRAQFVPVLSAVQHERNEAVRTGGQVQLQLVAEVTDKAVDTMRDVIQRNPEFADPASGYAAVDRALDSLPAARRQVTDGSDGMVVLSAYNAVVNTVLEYDRSLVGRFPDQNLAGTSIGLSELLGMREQVALEQAIGSLALRDGVLPDAARQLLIEAEVRLDDKSDDFRSQAPAALAARYDAAVKGQTVTAYQQMVDALRTTDPAALPFSQSEWEGASSATTDVMTDLTRNAAADLRSDSAELAESISNRAGLESVLLLTMVLLAAGIGGVLGQYLLRSVGLLRRTALAVAHERLPAAVASIRAGEGAKVEIEPVPLRSTEEFGQLARAFDAVNEQAVRSAAEEAALRSNLANIFTNLSRRSQGLVERQLRLMEQLEQKTEDPEQLENLFKIDHLATRMRRNNENLMVLSGTGLLRRFTEPLPLPDVLRAAISEVEHYQRAVVRSVPDVRIAGYAAGDLIRSISELIENATAFSPPDAQVTIASRLQQDGSAVVDIIDEGVGMGEKELRDANQRITGGGGVDVPISRQMGLFVVGRLTGRHGIHVRLALRPEGGLCASVLVPAGLVNIADPGQTMAFEMPWSTPPAAAAPATVTTGEPWLTATTPPAAAGVGGSTWLEGNGTPAVAGAAAPGAADSGLGAFGSGASGSGVSTGAGQAGGMAAGWLEAAREASSAADVPAAEGEWPQPAEATERPEPVARPTGRIEMAPASGAAAELPKRAPRRPAGDAATTGQPEPAAASATGTPTSGTPTTGIPTSGTPSTGIPVGTPAGSPSSPGSGGPGLSDVPTLVGMPAAAVTPPVLPVPSTHSAHSAPGTWLPAEAFEPVEVSGRLESAGIIVTLPELPSATTPASILFADNTIGGDGGGESGFSWLRTRPGAQATATPTPVAPVVTTGPAGLPKRVPRGQLLGTAQEQPQPPAGTRNAARARGFLSGFQAGIRQSENRKGETGP